MHALRVSLWAAIAVAVLVGVFFVPSLVLAQARSAAPTIEGAWQVTELVTAGPNAYTSTQPGLYIFTKKYYSAIWTTSSQPRKQNAPLPDVAKATDAEKLARYEEYQALGAQSGTYEVKGSMLTRRPLIAKNVGVMTGPPIESEFKLEGNTLLIITKPRPGSYQRGETRTKLVRVE
jgi:hypothetical protein